MSIHREISFEDEICAYLSANGWWYEKGDAANYDRALSLYPTDVVAWVQDTQPQAWEAMQKSHGANAEKMLLERLRTEINAPSRGTLDVLRHGIDILGLRQKLSMAQFKPALAMNADIITKYHAKHLELCT